MDKVTQRKKQGQDQWWYVEQLVVGMDATPTRKYFLTLVHLHQNRKTGVAWASQETLAREMCVDLSTVERCFRWAKQIGVVYVRAVRTGKRPSDQHNEYFQKIERLKEFQRPPEHPASMQGEGREHPAAMPGDTTAQHPAPMPAITLHFEQEHPANGARTPGTHAGEGLDLKQYEDKASVDNAGGSSLRSPAAAPAATTVPKTRLQEQIDSAVEDLEDWMRNILEENQGIYPTEVHLAECRKLFFQSANALGIPWRKMNDLYSASVQKIFGATPRLQAEPFLARPEAKPEPEPEDFPADKYQIKNLRNHARARGIDANTLRAYIWKTFRVTSPTHISMTQYFATMRYLATLSKVQ